MLKFLRRLCPFAGAALAFVVLAGEARATYGGGACFAMHPGTRDPDPMQRGGAGSPMPDRIADRL